MHREPLPEQPRISVIVTLYNGIIYLAEALDSIAAQTHPVDEIVVIDDGSSDTGPDLAAGYPRVRVVRKEHTGIIPTLNRGLEEARGDLITFLDHDDRWMAEKTALQLSLLRQRPEIDVVFGRARQFRMTEPRPGREYEVPLEEIEGACKGAAMFRRRAFERIGGFSATGGHDFLDWHTRGREGGLLFASVSEVVFERRQHFTNTGRLDRQQHVDSYMATIRAKLARQRAAPPPATPGAGSG